MKKRIWFPLECKPGKVWTDQYANDPAYCISNASFLGAFDEQESTFIWTRIVELRDTLDSRYTELAKQRHKDRARREAVARLNAAQATLAPPTEKPAATAVVPAAQGETKTGQGTRALQVLLVCSVMLNVTLVLVAFS